MLNEFKKFIMRGNVLDLAVAVIIGAAFGAVVTSMVQDLLMPPIGFIAGKVDFSNLYFNLDPFHSYPSVAAAEAAGAPIIKYGKFITALINFLIIAFAVFLIVRVANWLNRQKEEAPAPPELSTQEKLLVEIRDLLKAQSSPERFTVHHER